MEKSRKDSRASSRSLVSAITFCYANHRRVVANCVGVHVQSICCVTLPCGNPAAHADRILDTGLLQRGEAHILTPPFVLGPLSGKSAAAPRSPEFLPRRWILTCAAIIFVCRRLLLIQAEIRLRHIRRAEARRLRMQKLRVSGTEEDQEPGHDEYANLVAAYLTVRVACCKFITVCTVDLLQYCAVDYDDGCRIGSSRCKP
jgi:hypothetical protein